MLAHVMLIEEAFALIHGRKQRAKHRVFATGNGSIQNSGVFNDVVLKYADGEPASSARPV